MHFCFLKWLFAAATAIFIPLQALPQQARSHIRPRPAWEFLLKGGWQYTSFAGSAVKAAYAPGWQLGVALKIPLKYQWRLQPEILYSRHSALLTFETTPGGGTGKATYSFSHIMYPLLLSYRPNEIFEVQAGPQLGALLGNKVEADVRRTSLTPGDLSKWDYGFVAGLEFNVSPLALGLRYSHSFTKLATTANGREHLGDARLRSFQLYGALVF